MYLCMRPFIYIDIYIAHANSSKDQQTDSLNDGKCSIDPRARTALHMYLFPDGREKLEHAETGNR